MLKLVESQASVDHATKTVVRNQRTLLFSTPAEYDEYWDKERYPKLTARGFVDGDDMAKAQVENGEDPDALVMWRETASSIYVVSFLCQELPERPAPASNPANIANLDQAGIADAFDLSEYDHLSGKPAKDQGDPHDCQQCAGKGTIRRGSADFRCLACNGTGVKTKMQDRYAQPLGLPGERADRSLAKGVLPEEKPGGLTRQTSEPKPRVPFGVFTIVGDTFTGGYRTVRVRDGIIGGEKKVFLDFLSGPDNDNDFTACAFFDPYSGHLTMWKRYRGGQFEQEMQLAAHTLYGDPKAAGLAYARMSGRCSICNRTLTVPESIEAGIGPVCAQKVGW